MFDYKADSPTLSEGLGISQQRTLEIEQSLDKIFDDAKEKGEISNEELTISASSIPKNEPEAFFIGLVVGLFMGRMIEIETP